MTRLKIYQICFLLILSGSCLFSQTPYRLSVNSLFYSPQLDTAVLLSDKSLKSPWGAVARSAVLPGWGQIYTDHYFKAAIAFSVNGLLVYQIYYYEMKWREEKNEGYRAKRNLYTWYFSLAYLLTLVDAYVDAYLYKFDDAMKISYHIDRQEDRWVSRVELSLSWP